MTSKSSGGSNLVEILSERGSFLLDTCNRYFGTQDWAERGGFVKILIRELSNFDAVRAEVLQPVLSDINPELAERAEKERFHREELLGQLDSLVRDVGPVDVHEHDPEEIVRLMGLLREALSSYDHWEKTEVLRLLRPLGQERLDELGKEASKAARHGPTHPHPEKPYEDRTLLGRAWTSTIDHTRDIVDHPEQAVKDSGESGP